MEAPSTSPAWQRFDSIHITEAAERVRGVVRRTQLEPIAFDDARIELRAKLENRQEIGAFKARGAWNQVSQLSAAQKRAGVVCTSSGNHGKALAWAAERAGVAATIVMPKNAYANKVQACRDFGAEVVLCDTRDLAETECAARVARGATLVHPYDAERTIEGAGTVGLEIAEDWPEVDVVIVPVGGGGLVSGVALAIRQRLGARPKVFGAEPRGAPSLSKGLAAKRPVMLDGITSKVQGLTPPYSGQINIDVCSAALDGVVLLDDAEIFAGQRFLVALGETVEPAGAAAMALVLAKKLPAELLANRDAKRRLKVAVVVSGGNPDPEQIETLRREIAAERSRTSS